MSTPAAPSIVRTIIPLAVGQIVAFVATLGIEVTPDQEAAFTTVLGFVAAALYYLIIRFLEQKFPWMGALLGWATTPDGYSHGNGGVVESWIVDDGPNVIGEEAFFDDQDEVVDDPEELDELEAHKADEQAALDEDLATEVDLTPPPDDYEPKH